MRASTDVDPQTKVALGRSLLEDGFPFGDVSSIARADRYSRDAVYAAHKWWARRPPAVIRALLLASSLPAGTSPHAFWESYAADDTPLDNVHVGDPFMGGATTLVEASRLGASVTGIDVDPLAVLIAREELSPLGDPKVFASAAEQFMAHMTAYCADLYGMDDGQPVPLHFFYLRRVSCATCATESLMYRSPVVARDTGKSGGVVRRRGCEVFCPDCLKLRHLPEHRKGFRCCGRLHRLDAGTYTRSGHTCPACKSRRSHDELKTGQLPRVLIAVEETVPHERRRLRAPTDKDLNRLSAAAADVANLPPQVPVAPLTDIDGGRALHYGYETVADLFTSRQQLIFAAAFAWLDEQDFDASTTRRLRLAISNALAANNLLCGYATDYGRLAPLFMGVRSYAMPVLSVELNPLHPSAGRGTLAATLRRVRHSLIEETRRHVLTETGQVAEQPFSARRPRPNHVTCQSADRAFPRTLGACDVIVTDPPYFDFIAYSDLSLLYRAWLWPDSSDGSLGGRPIYPVGEDPATDFAKRLGRAFAKAIGALKPNGTFTFTFHSTNPEAWDALSRALRKAKLWVTAVFPVWTDARAAAHAHPGNCEWDVVFTCRTWRSTAKPTLAATVENWCAELGTDGPDENDLINLRLGLEAAHRVNTDETRDCE